MIDYRRKLRAMGQNAMIMLEDKNGEIPQSALPEELPYDLNQEKIAIADTDYGTWFLDCMRKSKHGATELASTGKKQLT